MLGTDQGAQGPVFSADGQWVGFWADGRLQKASASGSELVTLAEVPAPPMGASWGRDDMIVYGQREGVMQVPGVGGAPQLLISADEGEQLFGPQMLPGGEWVLMTVGNRRSGASWDEAEIVVQSVTTGERAVLTHGRGGRYVSTGHVIYVVNNVLFAAPFDLGSRQVTGRGEVPLVEGVRQPPGTVSGEVHVSVSSSGSLVYVPDSIGVGELFTLAWVGRDGDEELVPTTLPLRSSGHPRVSPDGTRVAIEFPDGDNFDVWSWDLERQTATQITFGEGFEGNPLWTADGARILFNSSSVPGGLLWTAADGTGQVEQLVGGPVIPHAWSPDGQLLVALGGDIGVLRMEGEPVLEALLDGPANERDPAVSPDGRWLAYRSDETGEPLVYVRPFPNTDDGRWRVSPDFGVEPVWSPDGQELFYRGESDLMAARIESEASFAAGSPQPLFSLVDYDMQGVVRAFDVAPDGDRFMLRKRDAVSETSGVDSFSGVILMQHWFEELKERVPVP